MVRLVLREAAVLTAAGLVAGTCGALPVARVLRAQLFEISPSDPVTYIAAVCSLVLVAAAATFLPARRAVRVDPIAALKVE